MELIVNGAPITVPDDTTVAELLIQLGLGRVKVAVELNREIVPRSQYEDHVLRAGDALEIVHAIGGG